MLLVLNNFIEDLLMTKSNEFNWYFVNLVLYSKERCRRRLMSRIAWSGFCVDILLMSSARLRRRRLRLPSHVRATCSTSSSSSSSSTDAVSAARTHARPTHQGASFRSPWQLDDVPCRWSLIAALISVDGRRACSTHQSATEMCWMPNASSRQTTENIWKTTGYRRQFVN